MKPRLLVVFVIFETIASFAAFAWSPVDSHGDTIESMPQCNMIAAGSEEEQKGEGEEEDDDEEEPDCD